MAWLNPAEAVVAAWSAVYAGFAATAIVRAAALRRVGPRKAGGGTVLIVRPCAGNEVSLHENLMSTAHAAASFGGAARIVFTTASPGDAASPVAAGVAAHLRATGLDATWRLAPTHRHNNKAGQLAAVADRAGDVDAVVVADSDVDLCGLDLDEVLAPLFEPNTPTAAVWCAPTECAAPRTWGDRVSQAILGGSLHAFVLLRGIDPGGLVGKTFAVRTDWLRRVGGFSGLADRLGEDAELARRVRARGGRIAVSRQVAHSRAVGRSLPSVLARYTRWLVVVRAQRPALLPSYPLLIAAAPLICTAALAVGGALGWIALAVAAIARVASSVAARALTDREITAGGVVTDVATADPLLLVALLGAVWSRRVSWRQRALTVGRGGRLVAEPET